MQINYRNFDLRIWRTEKGYRAQVETSDSGESSCDFTLPFSKDILEHSLRKLGPEQGKGSLKDHDLEAAKSLGGGLYKAIFSKDIGNSLTQSIKATKEGERLRIRLRLTGVPELASMPWEFLYDERADRFLVLYYKTSIVRYLDLAERIPMLAVKPPLRVLVMTSSPRGYDTLSVEKEWGKLRTALSKMPTGLMEVERLEKSTLSALQTRLSQGSPCHIFHFIGHGGFDSDTDKSVLVMEDEKRNANFVDGNRLGIVLHNHESLRMVILNACEGAVATSNDVFSGVAQSLIRHEMPAVIAMQFEISDVAAIIFASGFYEAVARGNPVDAAMLDARLAMFAAASSVEWGTPVLYLRAPDGRIFDTDLKDFEKKAEPLGAPPKPEPTVISEDASSIVSPAIKMPLSLPPTEPKGILSMKSAFYVERPADKTALELMKYPDLGITLCIQATGQMGASSLLHRVIDAAKQMGKQVVDINFQQAFNHDDFDSSEDFHRRFCGVLTDRLELDDFVDEYWSRYKRLSIGDRCTKYVQYLLQSLESRHLVLAMDEVDRLIDTTFRSSFFGLLRSWHNQRAIDERFERLNLVIVTSLEPYQLIDDPHQSPFNVSGEAKLSDFSGEEIRRLCELYGVNTSQQQLEDLFALIGGHPYLWQLSLHNLARERYSFEQLLSAARKGNEPYNQHLSAWYAFLKGKPQLRDTLKNILSRLEYDEHDFLILHRAGLVSREGSKMRLRCKLYENYFREQLHV